MNLHLHVRESSYGNLMQFYIVVGDKVVGTLSEVWKPTRKWRLWWSATSGYMAHDYIDFDFTPDPVERITVEYVANALDR